MRFLVTIIIFSVFLIQLSAAEERKPHFSKVDETLSVDSSMMNIHEKAYLCDFFLYLNKRIDAFFPENRRSDSTTVPLIKILFSKPKGNEPERVTILPTTKSINIYMPSSFIRNPGQNNEHMNKLVAAMIFVKGGRIPTQNTAVPYWLSVGITENLLSRMRGPFYYSFRIYPSLHNLICNDKQLPLTALLGAPPGSYDPEGCSLFREAAEILVKELVTLKYAKSNPFMEMAILYSKVDVKDPVTAFNSSFREQILIEEIKNPDKENQNSTDKEKTEAYFSTRLLKYSLNYFLPATPEMSERTFKDVREIQLPGGKSTDITNLPAEFEKLKDQKLKEEILNGLKKKTLLAAISIAPELRQPLSSLRLALFRFSSGEISGEDFTDSTTTSCQEFETKLKHFKDIEKYLEELETENHMSIETAHNQGIIRKLDKIERDTRPALNHFMDETEKKFGK